MGGYDSDGNKDPYMIVFVYKTGFKNSVDGKNFKPLRKNSKENHSPAVLCSHASNEAESMCSDSSDDTYRGGMSVGSEKPVTHINIDVDVEELVQDKRGMAT